MRVTLIAALSKNKVIGRSGNLPWHLPEDMKFFREKTRGHVVVMGRKTFDTIGKPLPHRPHVIVTRNPHWTYPGLDVAPSLPEAIEKAKVIEARNAAAGGFEPEVFVCGGGEIYTLALPLATGMVLTEVDLEIEGDTYFPDWSGYGYKEKARNKVPGPISFSFVEYER